MTIEGTELPAVVDDDGPHVPTPPACKRDDTSHRCSDRCAAAGGDIDPAVEFPSPECAADPEVGVDRAGHRRPGPQCDQHSAREGPAGIAAGNPHAGVRPL